MISFEYLSTFMLYSRYLIAMQLVIHATVYLAINKELFFQCHVPACNCKVVTFQ